jgi:hypothetical protein
MPWQSFSQQIPSFVARNASALELRYSLAAARGAINLVSDGMGSHRDIPHFLNGAFPILQYETLLMISTMCPVAG